MTEAVDVDIDETEQPVVCEKHGVETGLRCNRCGKPICGKCAIRTPTGYRCEACIKGQQKVFDTSETKDIIVAPIVAGVLGFIGGLIVPRFGFWSILIAPFAGTIIAEAVRYAINKRRSQQVFKTVAITMIIGGALPILWSLVLFTFVSGSVMQALFAIGFRIIWQAVYIGLATSTAYTQLSGIKIGRR